MSVKSAIGSFAVGGYIVPDEIKEDLLPHHRAGLSYTASGYGSKIPTTRKARFGKVWRRIYCAVFSNSGTCYVIIQRKHYVIQDRDVREPYVMNTNYYGLSQGEK